MARSQTTWQVQFELPSRYFVHLFEDAPSRVVRQAPDGVWSSWGPPSGSWVEAADQSVGAKVLSAAADPNDNTWVGAAPRAPGGDDRGFRGLVERVRRPSRSGAARVW